MTKSAGLQSYRDRRDFTATREPAPRQRRRATKAAPIFVVQEHHARRLHWDFRLEHKGVLLSWAVPKGPSMDPRDKRLAVHVEDHPLAYAAFSGTIPAGQYGAGEVAIWDSGTWRPVGDVDAGLREGELKFDLDGKTLRGRFVLIRLKPRPKERGENWLLIKEHDEAVGDDPPIGGLAGVTPPRGAIEAAMPRTQAPQLATTVEEPPAGDNWLTEIKFDGYRLLAFKSGQRVRLLTRNGHDWTERLPRIAASIVALKPEAMLLDGELVALAPSGVSDFGKLQAALSDGDDRRLVLYVFDLLHLNGWDLRPCRLEDRKAALRDLSRWEGAVRYSDHHAGEMDGMRRHACAMGLEGIICKKADAPYRAGRGDGWRKLKCHGRDEFLVIGWTPRAGSRAGIGSLHVAYYDPNGGLHYAGGVGTGFSDAELASFRARLDAFAADRPKAMETGGEPVERSVRWVRPDLVIEVQYQSFTETGRLRHAVYLGLREDKMPDEVIRDAPAATDAAPVRKAAAREASVEIAGVRITHPDRELWPGITKQALAEYWRGVAPRALAEIARRPLALVRCPDGIGGEHFFQKHATRGFPAQLRGGEADGAPFLTVDDEAGLIACAQMSAIELHAWGADGADPLHPDRVVFDLDPGEGIAMPDIVAAAKEVKARLEAAGLAAFCRTSGGKGLHVVAPLIPKADWETTRAWCRALAEAMERDSPDHYVASVPKARRTHRILVDWLRNGLGSTAIASFSPRARPGAGVATRLTWREVTAKLDPAAFTLASVPDRLSRQRDDPWKDFHAAARPLPTSLGSGHGCGGPPPPAHSRKGRGA